MGPQNPTNQLHLPGCFPQAFRSLDCHLVLALYGLEADRDHHCETKEGHHLFAYVTLMSRLFNLGEFQLFDNSVTLSYPGNITYIFWRSGHTKMYKTRSKCIECPSSTAPVFHWSRFQVKHGRLRGFDAQNGNLPNMAWCLSQFVDGENRVQYKLPRSTNQETCLYRNMVYKYKLPRSMVLFETCLFA